MLQDTFVHYGTSIYSQEKTSPPQSLLQCPGLLLHTSHCLLMQSSSWACNTEFVINHPRESKDNFLVLHSYAYNVLRLIKQNKPKNTILQHNGSNKSS